MARGRRKVVGSCYQVLIFLKQSNHIGGKDYQLIAAIQMLLYFINEKI